MKSETKKKSTAVTIGEEVHKKMKLYVVKNDLKVTPFVESAIIEKIKNDQSKK